MKTTPTYYMSPEGIAAINAAGKRLVAVWRAERDKARAQRLRFLLLARDATKRRGDKAAAQRLKHWINTEFSVYDLRQTMAYEPGAAARATAAAQVVLAHCIAHAKRV